MSKKTNSNPASEEKANAASAAEQTDDTAQQTEAEAAKQEEENAEPEIELIDVLPSASEGYGFAEPTAAPEATLPPATK